MPLQSIKEIQTTDDSGGDFRTSPILSFLQKPEAFTAFEGIFISVSL
jgi:hypothetical protein